MKVKTSELAGAALDRMVTVCEGFIDDDSPAWERSCEPFTFSTNWAQGGPIMEREDINVTRYTRSEVTETGQEVYRKDGWTAFTTATAYWMKPTRTYGPTPLIAAMRCYVASKLGDTVKVPDELM